ncbi:hypothetical protein Tco_1121279 [Tanacetum coccineum]|uniref:Uncharacterized protein n=1 Tax=Tanacetum coccineum TaxID=301880 RepID=A0ABQ5IXF9_9ASTR
MTVLDQRDKDWSKVVLTDEVKDYVVAKEVIVISSNDEEIVLMGDISFSTTNDDSDDDESSRRYRKISMTGYVLFLRARDAPTLVDQYVRKPIKSHVKLTNCVIALRDVNAPNVDVGSLSTRRKSR